MRCSPVVEGERRKAEVWPTTFYSVYVKIDPVSPGICDRPIGSQNDCLDVVNARDERQSEKVSKLRLSHGDHRVQTQTQAHVSDYQDAVHHRARSLQEKDVTVRGSVSPYTTFSLSLGRRSNPRRLSTLRRTSAYCWCTRSDWYVRHLGWSYTCDRV